jgi:hypothetical protein
MKDATTDRFGIVIGTDDYANHIVDLTADQPGEESLLPVHSLIPGELICNQSSKLYGTELVSFSEYTAERELDDIDFEDDAPDGLCSYCWSSTKTMLDEEAKRDAEGVYDRIGTVGYRLRWKQKGRAREEWYDIVVRPETTMAELDRLVCRFTTLDDFHLRLYGLEDEYLDSSLNVLPDRQYEEAGRPSQTKASEMTIGEVADRATLWEGDRLSMVYDFGTPSHYYCIVKEVYEPIEIDRVLEDSAVVATTDTAAISTEKRP